MKKAYSFIFLVFVAGSLASCSSEDSSNNGTGNNLVGAPDAILDYTLVQTVTSTSSPSTVQAGGTITYRFLDIYTIANDSFDALSITSWSYVLVDNVATVDIQYGTAGSSVDTLTFTSASGGTFESQVTFGDGSSATLTGTFSVSVTDTSSYEIYCVENQTQLGCDLLGDPDFPNTGDNPGASSTFYPAGPSCASFDYVLYSTTVNLGGTGTCTYAF